jgi:hypothetical protein
VRILYLSKEARSREAKSKEAKSKEASDKQGEFPFNVGR